MELVAGRVRVDVGGERDRDRITDPGGDQRQAGSRGDGLVEGRADPQPRPGAELLPAGPEQAALDGEGRGIVAGGHEPEREVDPLPDAQVRRGRGAPKVREDGFTERRETR